MNRRLSALFAGALLAALPVAAAHAGETLKIATLAPEGSGWMNQFHEWGRAIEKRTNGSVKVKFYSGGVAGDERDAVRKMRLGNINGAAVTAVGLGLIQSEVRVLELPFMFKSYDELDFVRDTLAPDFQKKFEEKGYILLGWGDVGPVHLFTNNPIRSKADLQQSKLWSWTDDPIVRTLFDLLGLNGVPLGVPDVLPSLQTGVINGCYGSPLSTLALQWHSKVKYITSMVISQSIGATVITKAEWEKLSQAERDVILDESKQLTTRLLKQVRADNETALKKMKELGLAVVETPPSLIEEFQKQGMIVRDKLATGDKPLFTKEFRARVEGLVAQRRGGK